MRRYDLTEQWTFKQRDAAQSLEDARATSEGWLPATVPGVVQVDLLALGLIPDPYKDMNELAAQWTGACDWLYRRHFTWPPEGSAGGEADGTGEADEGSETTLCFGGLDTCATVWLNGERILVSDNMFVAHRVPVQALLRPGENELLILFESPLRIGQAREAEHGARAVWNGDASRVYVRKAQYHYGWDWGPCLLTAGPWRPVWLERATARIGDIHCPVEVSEDLSRAQFPVEISIERAASLPDATLRLALYDPQGALVGETTIAALAETLRHTFSVERPALWWPSGYGARPRYRLVIELRRADAIVERQEQMLGVRRLRLIQEEIAGERGKSFRFEVNNTPIFCGGANWIPADLMLPRVSAARYRTLLRQAAEAHMVMLRVWGGGVYESDEFYDLCDELGLLVWQDFLFACGIYPAHKDFMQSVRAEAEQAIRRLRRHPSLALWCGNNEDYSLARSHGYALTGPLGEPFPARAIYEYLLPELCARLDPTRPYWPGSPYTSPASDDPDDLTAGDTHVWSVWHQAMRPYQEYGQVGGRFVSEFGMVALPSAASLAAMASPAERFVGSRTLDFHFKAEQGVRRLAAYLSENVPVPDDLARYAYATQVMQAEALAAAYRGWRRQFGGPGRYRCGGALVWQLNDCWPTISWSIIDDALEPKLAYYAVRRALAPVALELALELARAGADTGATDAVTALWAANSTAEVIEGVAQVRRWSLAGQLEGEEHRAVSLAPRQTTPLGETRLTVDATHVLQARLLVGGVVVARAALWPEPLKYLTLADPQIALERAAPGELRLRAAAPAKSVWLEGPAGGGWSDNGFDLFPDDLYGVQSSGEAGGGEGLARAHSLYDLRPALRES